MKKLLFSLTAVLLVISVIGFIAAFVTCHANNLSYLTEMKTYTQQRYNSLSLHVRCGLFEIDLPYNEYTVFEEDAYLPPWFKSIFEYSTYNYLMVPQESEIRETLQGCYKPAVDAVIEYTESGYILHVEYDEYSFDVDKLTEAVIQAMSAYETNLDFFEAHIYPEVFYTDLQQEYEELAWVNDFSISYTTGLTITAMDLAVDGLSYWELDEDKFAGIESALRAQYDTDNTIIDFTTTGGETFSTAYTTYGEKIWWDKESKFLREALESKASAFNREPYIYGFDGGYQKGTYIEVSLADQHVWHYVNGTLCCESDCVTGTKGKHDTPPGIYCVSEMIPGKYLTGDDYKTWVNRWMRLTNSGIGLHDATWRGSFGGSIYERNGSHGCINLPPSYAYALYEEVSNGIMTIIY